MEKRTRGNTGNNSVCSGCGAMLLAVTLALTAYSGGLLAQGPGRPPGGGGPGFGRPTGPPGMGDRPSGPGPSSGGAPSAGMGGMRPGGPAGRWWDEGKFAKSVGLTGDQQRRMDSVFQENRNALVSGLDSLRKAQSRLDALYATDHPSEAAVLSEIQNVAQARADLAKTSAHMQLQIRNEMTNDQLNKLDKLK